MEMLRVSIPNWEKFNPRADRGNFHWFRMQNDFFMDQRVFQLNSDDKLVLILLLCESSRKNGEEFDVSVEYASSLLRLSSSTVFKAVERLSKIQLVACNVFFDANGTGRTGRTGQDVRDETASGSRPAAPALLEIWNTNCGSLPKANAVSGGRMTTWRTRWGDRPDEAYWVSVVQRLSKSSFCNGENDKGWRATIDFLLKPDTHLKTMEGKYDNGGTRARPKTREETVSAANQALWERVDRGEV